MKMSFLKFIVILFMLMVSNTFAAITPSNLNPYRLKKGQTLKSVTSVLEKNNLDTYTTEKDGNKSYVTYTLPNYTEQITKRYGLQFTNDKLKCIMIKYCGTFDTDEEFEKMITAMIDMYDVQLHNLASDFNDNTFNNKSMNFSDKDAKGRLMKYLIEHKDGLKFNFDNSSLMHTILIQVKDNTALLVYSLIEFK